MPGVTIWVVVGRISAILGMGIMISLGILFLLGGIWLWGAAALALTAPFVVLMFAVERSKAAQAMTGRPPGALEP